MLMEDRIEIQISLTETDYLEFLKEGMKSRGIGRSLWIFGAYAVLVTGSAGVTAYLTGNYSYASLIPMAIFLFMLFLVYYELKVKSKTTFRNDPTLSKPFMLSMDNAGIEMSREENALQIRWNEVFDFSVTAKSVLIYLNPVRAIIIPERFFVSADQIVGISNMLQEKVLSKRPPVNKARKYFRIAIILLIAGYIIYSVLSRFQ